MTVYIDVYFFNNFIIDLFLILLSGLVLKRQIKCRRIVAAALLGAFYSCAAYFVDISYLKLIISIAMIVISFRLKFKEYVKQTGVFYITSYVFAGIVIRLMPFGSGNIAEFNNSMYLVIPEFVVIAAGVTSFLFLYIFLNSAIKKKSLSDFYGKAVIKSGGRKVCTTTFADSGNSLTDYVTGLPVCIISSVLFKKLKRRCDLLVPCITVNGESYLDAFIPDEFIFNGKKINVVLAVSETINDRDYGVLANNALLKGENEIVIPQDDRIYKNDLCG